MIRELTLSTAAWVCARMRESDWHEIQTLTAVESRDEFAAIAWRGSKPLAYEVWRDKRPVCIGGFSPMTPGCLQIWMVATDEFERRGGMIWRAAVQRLVPVAFASGVRSLRAQVIAGNAAAERFAERAGLRPEVLLVGYGRSGEMVKQFVMTREDYERRWRR